MYHIFLLCTYIAAEIKLVSISQVCPAELVLPQIGLKLFLVAILLLAHDHHCEFHRLAAAVISSVEGVQVMAGAFSQQVWVMLVCHATPWRRIWRNS